MQGQVLRLVERLRRRRPEGEVRNNAGGTHEDIIEPFKYQRRLGALQNYAGTIITEAIAQTPERYENSVRRGLAAELAESGSPRTQAINFFSTSVAPVLAEYADVLEERREHIISTTLKNARANSFYRGVMMTVEAAARQVKRDTSWSIEARVKDFVTEERWEERYVPILRKYMEKE